MEIKDLAGLSQPLTQLIEVASIGLGRVTEPYLIRKNADAKVHEINAIANALKENEGALKKLEYHKGDVKLLAQAVPENSQNLLHRTESRKLYQESKRQINLESVVSVAASEIKNDTEIPEKSLDEDWVSRFFNAAQDISNEEMQNLWGKVLAGELRKPNTYSLRTLDALRNISPREAELFCKVGALAVGEATSASWILNDDRFLDEKLGISFSDILELKDLGLMMPNDLEVTITETKMGVKSYLFYAGRVLIISRQENTPQIKLPVTVFSKVGNELLSLVDQQINDVYLHRICEKIRINKSIMLTLADVTKRDGQGFHYDREREIS